MGAFLWSLFTLVTPWVAHNFTLLILCRLLLGAGEGLGFPAIHSLIAKWIPHHESSRAVAAVTAASYAGAILALLISAPIAASFLGWKWIFYVFALMGFGWNIPWFMYSASSPDQWLNSSSDGAYNKEVGQNCTNYMRVNSDDERDGFRQRSPAIDGLEDGHKSQSPDESDPAVVSSIVVHPSAKYRGFVSSENSIPWNEIFSSKEVWAILLNQFCSSWGFYVLLSWLPTYYKDVFDVDLNELGYFSVLPYIVQGLVGLASGFVGDYAINELEIPVITVRRVAQCVGMIGPGVFLLLAGYTASSVAVGMIYISLALGFNSLTLIGVSISQLDIAPKFAGIIFGLGNTAATLPGILGVTVTGILLESKEAWPLVFGLAAAFYFTGAVIWYFWGGGNRVVIH
ncbi:MFS general substrate transporter [Basidiobolus meristosporus CBS 931.73]|uniref:MFS general substrate transporter n=1 Tax=Basidiobolus meristosporus CBS 931.73 TaxID=1314790 RepID=A0A1Y1YVY1_9FUNG|nr:MFS general substrate transporter [Basidiobolus meristosporus CBS 931.73]|eukprot:ORY02223.1 MFS general substrate transporter [Basidiobolus meristosporus CBS 931.73]